MRLKLVLLILCYTFCINRITAQIGTKKISITGTVHDADNHPIADAIILIDDIKTSTITDSKGNFRVRVDPAASIIGIFTFGCGIREESISGRTQINFNFNSVPSSGPYDKTTGITILGDRKNKPGEESVDVGYAHLKKKYLTTDIDFIDGTNKKYASYSSVYDMIQREVSGVRVLGNKIIIQGANDLFGATGPIVILDGSYVDGEKLDFIQPTTVKSISVLKGTAAAIYGSRGFGGAVIITTKSYNDY
jgi:TonB-dependent SusC/RagA subfamily outer membrane receptor